MLQTETDKRARFAAEGLQQTFQPLPLIGDNGLTLGRGTLLAPCRPSRGGQDLCDTDRARIVALLSVVYGRQVNPGVAKYVERAVVRWRAGQMALAQIELAFAQFPRLETEADAYRLFLADQLLADGMTPAQLISALGFDADLSKYDSNQPRVPAGNGRASGRFGSGSGVSTDAFFGPPPAAARSFLVHATPGSVRALGVFASRFSVPTALLGALFIPTPNSGGITEGTLPDAPDIRFRRDGPGGTLRLAARTADGADIVVGAQSRRGMYVDVVTGRPIGRDLGEQLYLDLDGVRDAIEDARKRVRDPPARLRSQRCRPMMRSFVRRRARIRLMDPATARKTTRTTCISASIRSRRFREVSLSFSLIR